MIEADKLTKYYGEVAAAREVSFQVKKGDILGFLGPNGAGKSTTMKMLTTFLYPTSGTAILNGYDILNNPLKVRESVGYLPENAPLYEDMLVKDFLRFVAKIRRIEKPQQAIEKVMDRCFIHDMRNKPIYTLSKGYRQRVCFAQAIIHDPDILILDEPTTGLDPNQKAEVRKMIESMGEEKAILLSTHILDEAMATCNRAIIISRGEIKIDDTPEKLIQKAKNHGKNHIKIKGAETGKVQKQLKKLDNVSKVHTKTDDDGVITATIIPHPGQDASGQVLECVKKQNWDVISMTVEEGRLEDVFRTYTEVEEK